MRALSHMMVVLAAVALAGCDSRSDREALADGLHTVGKVLYDSFKKRQDYKSPGRPTDPLDQK